MYWYVLREVATDRYIVIEMDRHRVAVANNGPDFIVLRGPFDRCRDAKVAAFADANGEYEVCDSKFSLPAVTTPV